MKLLINLLVNAIAVFVASQILPGVHVNSFITALLVALILGVLNLLVKPVLYILTLPINLLTFGLFSFILNGVIVLLTSFFVKGFTVDNLIWGIIFSVIISIISSLLHKIVK